MFYHVKSNQRIVANGVITPSVTKREPVSPLPKLRCLGRHQTSMAHNASEIRLGKFDKSYPIASSTSSRRTNKKPPSMLQAFCGLNGFVKFSKFQTNSRIKGRNTNFHLPERKTCHLIAGTWRISDATSSAWKTQENV